MSWCAVNTTEAQAVHKRDTLLIDRLISDIRLVYEQALQLLIPSVQGTNSNGPNNGGSIRSRSTRSLDAPLKDAASGFATAIAQIKMARKSHPSMDTPDALTLR